MSERQGKAVMYVLVILAVAALIVAGATIFVHTCAYSPDGGNIPVFVPFGTGTTLRELSSLSIPTGTRIYSTGPVDEHGWLPIDIGGASAFVWEGNTQLCFGL